MVFLCVNFPGRGRNRIVSSEFIVGVEVLSYKMYVFGDILPLLTLNKIYGFSNSSGQLLGRKEGRKEGERERDCQSEICVEIPESGLLINHSAA